MSGDLASSITWSKPNWDDLGWAALQSEGKTVQTIYGDLILNWLGERQSEVQVNLEEHKI